LPTLRSSLSSLAVVLGAVALERAAELVEDAFGRFALGAAQAVRGLVDLDRLLAVDLGVRRSVRMFQGCL
jgi:hypothetical protein